MTSTIQLFNEENGGNVLHKPNCLRRRTSLEIILFVIIGLVILLALIFIILYSLSVRKSNETCYSSDCVKTAARLMDWMDKEVDPCDDFFEYACGSWKRNNIIPQDRSSINTFSQLADSLDIKLKGLLEAPTTRADENAVVKAKNLYYSCYNETEIDSRGLTPLKDFLTQLGGWPMVDKTWDVAKFNLMDTLVQLRLYGNFFLIYSGVTTDDKNSEYRVIGFDQPGLVMPGRDYYLKGWDDKMLTAYRKLAKDVALFLGADASTVDQDVKDMVQFEVELANITTPEEDRRDSEAMYHKMSLKTMSTDIPGFDWLLYLNKIFINVNMTLTDQEQVVVYAPEYFEKLLKLLDKYKSKMRIVANYVIWGILFNRVDNLPAKYREAKISYYGVVYGTKVEQARWKNCVNFVNNKLGLAVGRLFVNKYFNTKAKDEAEEMIENIRKAFNDILKTVNWMDDQTRKEAKAKADAILQKIGYPDDIMNNTFLTETYKNYDMIADKYFENVVNILRASSLKNCLELREKIDKSKWSVPPAMVNAFYSASKNQIMFPAGILQPPFYSSSYPKFLNYGGIGVVMGHEITHGFDDEGRQFDKDGNLKQWWTPWSVKNFKDKAQCIIDQYGNYTVEEVNMNLNGIKTQGENIADNGGLKEAYMAYQDWIESARGGKSEQLLPGIGLNNNQLFFLNFAQVWCGSMRPENYISRIQTGRHSPGRFRVIGTLSNSPQFAEVYNCPAGSTMNPKKKCSVW